jgi:EAL domain-containing protein (putative c-di-GMP-specific phosphodiesterase class I)
LATVAWASDFDEATLWLTDVEPYRVLASTDSDLSERTDGGRRPFDGSAQEILVVENGEGRAYLVVPLRAEQGSPAAMLTLARSSPGPISPKDLTLGSDPASAVIELLDLLERTSLAELDEAEREVAEAIDSGEILPWYQPIVEMKTGSIIGLEALARWVRPTGEIAIPNSFIHVAERSGSIIDLDLAVLRKAVLDLRRWQQAFPAVRLSVNMSGTLMDQEDWDQAVWDAVREAGVSPDSIDLELTATTPPRDPDSFKAAIQQLRKHGFRIWLDDIGSGWPGLQNLLRGEIDGIKMERTFALLLGTRGEATVRAVASRASKSRVMVTLEGIETAEQAQLARELGCDYGQGYFWSRAVPAETIATLTEGWNAGAS